MRCALHRRSAARLTTGSRGELLYIFTAFGDIMNPVIYIPRSKRLLEQLSEVLRYKQYSLKT